MPSLIPHSRPSLTEEDARAVAEVVRGGQLAQGPKVAEFEGAMASLLGRRGAVALSSGSAALHLALKALGVKEGDGVALPSFVCAALAHAARYLGAEPQFMEVEPEGLNIDPADLRSQVKANTKAIVVPHLFGRPAELEDVLAIGLPVIEDCAQSLGASCCGKPTGSWGRVAVVSFYATKMLATGEGGMLLADDPDLLQKARDLRDYDERDDGELRYNYKMTEMQAALGLCQLARLEDFVIRRRELAERYGLALSGLRVQLPQDPPRGRHVFYRYVLLLPPDRREDLEAILQDLERGGVTARRPIYRPLHQLLGGPSLPVTEDLWARAISIPLYPSLDEAEVDRIVKGVRTTLARRGC